MNEESEPKPSRLSPGKKLRILRISKSLTQAEMATILGVSRSAVNAFESRPNSSPNSETVDRASAHFGIAMSWFYDGKYNVPFEPSSNAKEIEAVFVYPQIEWRPLVPCEVGEGRETLYQLSANPEFRVPFFNPEELQRSMFVRVGGDSLAPRVPSGSTMVFLQDQFPPHRTMILLRNQSTETYCIKMFFSDYRNKANWFLSFVEGVDRMRWSEIDSEWLLLGIARYIIHPYPEGTPNVEVSTHMQYLTVDYHDSASIVERNGLIF